MEKKKIINTEIGTRFRPNKKLTVIGFFSACLGIIPILQDFVIDIIPRIVISSALILLGIMLAAIGTFYMVRFNRDAIEESFLLYKKRIELNDGVEIMETTHYSNYEIGSVYLCVINGKDVIKIRPWIIDTKPIISTAENMGYAVIHNNPTIECGSKCQLPDIEKEALSYRLIIGKKRIEKSSYIIVLAVLTFIINFEYGSWILLATSTYWYYLVFEHHDLFFARGDLIIGDDVVISNIWKKLDLKVDIFFFNKNDIGHCC